MHYFIDEAGDLDIGSGTSDYFLIGCVLIDDPEAALAKIITLQRQILESVSLSRYWQDFRQQGFHASEKAVSNILQRTEI